MSIQQNGRQHRKSSAAKKSANNNAAPTNTVYPILRPSQKTGQEMTNGQSNGSRLSRGQCVNPRPAMQPRIVTSVAEFVSEVIPQSSPPHAQNEQILWVRIQKCPLDEHQRRNTFIVLVGLARGYQIWMLQENGSCEEVVSERRGPLKVGHLLPICDKNIDKFQDERPLLALVDGNPLCTENKYCSVDFLSLKTGKGVHTLKFDEPVMDLASSNNSFVVVLSETILVYDNANLNELYTFMTLPSADSTLPPVFAVSDCFLAFADSNLNSSIQSCGGRVDEDDNSYSGQVISAAKTLSKTVTSIGETLVSSFSNQNNEKRNNIMIDLGVVSVVNLNDLPRSNDVRPINNHYVAHFIAHQTGVSYIAFGNGGRLLFTSNELATTFNVFILQPHPVNCRLSSVQQLYTLHRGNSAAKVVDVAFSNDNRWLAVATNHGTTHVFAICPFGGGICLRTHGARFIKESIFERTAGLNAEMQVSFNVHSSSKQPPSSTFVDHPALSKNPIISRTVVNPRITRFPPPIVLWSYAKIKQHLFSSESLSAWASDNNPVSLANGRQNTPSLAAGQPFFESNRRLALCFGTVYGDRCAPAETPILFIMNACGMLYQYKIEIRKERLNSSGSANSLNADIGGLSPNGGFQQQFNANNAESGRVLEAPIQIRTVALSQWSLTRGRGTSGVNFVGPPLHETSPILEIGKSSKRARRKNQNNGWLQHVEVKTYSSPHRRLWMGPQFTFGIYNSQKHASAELVSPNTANKPVQMFTTAQKCCPVLIEKNSNIGILRCDTSVDSTSRIVCGSWTSDSGLYSNDPLASLKEQLEDAMRDQRQANGDSYSPSSSSSK